MKIVGKIFLDKTPGRTGPFIKKQLEHDYFMGLQITHVDGVSVGTNVEFFNAMWATTAPTILINNKPVNALFSKVTLPPNAKDVPHVTLGNFPDFRVDRNTDNGLDEAKVNAAREFQDQTVEFEMSENDYELIIVTKDPELTAHIMEDHLVGFTDGNASIKVESFVGPNRDAIFNIKPSLDVQKKLGDISNQVFGKDLDGKDFAIWNAAKKPIPYHVTLAQTNQMVSTLEQACKEIKKNDVVAPAPISAPTL